MRSRMHVLVVSSLLATLAALMPTGQAQAASLSVDQFVASYNGRYVDFDGWYGAQCVDLFEFYNRDVVGAPRVAGDAWQLYGNAPSNYYDKLPASASPSKGDVAIWGSNLPGSGGGGHVAIVLSVVNASTLQVFGQNSPMGAPSQIKNQSTAYLTGYLHPRNLPSEAANNPKGAFDTITTPGPGQVRVTGWAFDPNATSANLNIHVYVGGPAGSAGAVGFDTGPAITSRPDVGAAFPGAGDNHGYDATVSIARGGTLPVYVYAINAPGTAGGNVLLGAKDVTVADPNPTGSFDGLSSPQGGELRVTGWTLDPNDVTQALNFHVYVGGPAGDPNAEGHAFGPADGFRPDVDAAFPGVGEHHGIDWSFPTTKTGVQPVYLYAINIGAGDNVLIGSKTVDVGQGPPSIAASVAPAVRGRAVVGRVLRARPGLWTVDDITLHYQWLRAGHVITDATQPTYRLTRADRGHRLRVRVSADREGYVSGLSTSSATRRVR